MHIRCIVMASGQSKRMGCNKLAIKLGDKSILEHVIENVKRSCVSETVVVYGKYDVQTDLKKIYNPEYEIGMSTSIIAGLSGFEGDGVLIVLGDMPFVGPSIINKLIDTASRSSKGIIVPSYNGERGNPVILKSCYFKQLLHNTGDKGARAIIRENSHDIELCEIDEDGILIDIDDEQTLDKYIHRFEE